MEVPAIVGSRIGQQRKAAGLSQEALGNALEGVLGRRWFPQAVSEAENGRRAFTAEELVALARVLGCEVGWLFEPLPGESIELAGHTFAATKERVVSDAVHALEEAALYLRSNAASVAANP